MSKTVSCFRFVYFFCTRIPKFIPRSQSERLLNRFLVLNEPRSFYFKAIPLYNQKIIMVFKMIFVLSGVVLLVSDL